MAPTTPAVAAFGLGFGAAAADLGLSPGTVTLMSAVVFASGAQFAALDLWDTPSPWLALALTVLAINARYLVLGAAVAHWLASIPLRDRLIAVACLSDANWAAAQAAREAGEHDPGHLLGGGMMIWVAWVFSTLTGALAGGQLGDLTRFGLDALIPAFFALTLLDLPRAPGDGACWIASAAVAAFAAGCLAPHWAILAAVAAGAAFIAGRHALH